MNDQPFVLLESFPTPHEAHLAANALRAVRIPVKIADESTVSAMPHLELALGGVKLFVPASDLEDAIRILRGDADLAIHPYREPADDESLYEPDVEEEDDLLSMKDVRVMEDHAHRAFRASIVGLLVCPGLFHLYSISLLLQLPSNRQELSEKARSRARIAWGINAIVIVIALLAVVSYLGT